MAASGANSMQPDKTDVVSVIDSKGKNHLFEVLFKKIGFSKVAVELHSTDLSEEKKVIANGIMQFDGDGKFIKFRNDAPDIINSEKITQPDQQLKADYSDLGNFQISLN